MCRIQNLVVYSTLLGFVTTTLVLLAQRSQTPQAVATSPLSTSAVSNRTSRATLLNGTEGRIINEATNGAGKFPSSITKTLFFGATVVTVILQ